ncbi:MAG: squalene--hopene cyclase, partial [Gammaproteobacteria bacterium]|nr:squalene--hopene cyclase [Gammaproteobacteria bacterium]
MTDRYETNVEVIAKSDAATAAEVIETHDVLPLEPAADPLTKTLTSAARALLTRQSAKGFWHFDLEADATIPSEYLMLHHFLGTVDAERQQRIVAYLKRRQLENGSWALFEGGPGNISATVKAYFALKLAGEDQEAEYMQRTRRWVHANGGAEKVNVFTRIALALFGQMPWRVVPAMPIEFMFLPNWWFINLKKVSYWSRCVIVPLLIIFAKRPVVEVEEKFCIPELFLS